MWPVVWWAMELVLTFQRPDGAFRWGGDPSGAKFSEAQITGNASIFHALDCAIRIAAEMRQPEEDFVVAHAAPEPPSPNGWTPPSNPVGTLDGLVLPILGGAMRGERAQRHIAERWDEFVVPGKGARCVHHRPWVTGAETSELALALDALGDTADAIALVESIQHLRDPDGSY